MMIPVLEPGEQWEDEITLRHGFRPQRLIAKVNAFPPQFRYYTKKVGGSKRRGKLASLRYHADLLSHPHRRALLSVDDIRVGVNSQLIGNPIPIQVFDPAHALNVMMDAAQPGQVMAFSYTNREFSRSIAGVIACIGTTI